MTYEDLLVVPYKAGGRDEHGMDCYGLVIECCKRAFTPLKDIRNNGHVEVKELLQYVSSLNVIECFQSEKGCIVQCEYNGELHIGYMVDKKRVLHMTETGARVSALVALRNVKFYKVETE